ncbi:MAG: YceH family protein [Acidobacteria bacterium]|nr:YceH family protein [Acidobacteriota bacterium]
MIRQLDRVEARVLGSLLEKQQATPENYPLTMNALLLACNQKTSREPVTDYSETDIEDALARLRQEKLVWKVTGARVPRWDHNFEGVLTLSREAKAIFTVLLLRGPQTLAELRTRTERLHAFESPDEIETTLRVLAGREEPLVRQLERMPGQKETRWAHLLCGEPEIPTFDEAPARSRQHAGSGLEDRLAALEATVERLESELLELKRVLGA